MNKSLKFLIALSFFSLLAACYNDKSNDSAPLLPNTDLPNAESLADLGAGLFFDKNLSRNRTQSCATCHNPDRAFIDDRENTTGAAVSLGDDDVSLGDRNTPTSAYASFAPEFSLNKEGEYVGGQFHDGRAASLLIQAGDPIVNPIEMALADHAAVAARIQENPFYRQKFKDLFGESIFSKPEQVEKAVRQSLVAFQQTALFSPFDSKYDRYLRGEYTMTRAEARGRSLFFSTLVNCNSCHMLHSSGHLQETFSNYQYHNIGIPTNIAVRKKNGLAVDYQDLGLLQNPEVTDLAQSGKFKVPTLRNIAVTGPYMHNGIFKDLRTALLFYNQYLVGGVAIRKNPETGKSWGKPEVSDTISLELLKQGQPLDYYHLEALTAFLRTLTDKRYEHLLSDTAVNVAAQPHN